MTFTPIVVRTWVSSWPDLIRIPFFHFNCCNWCSCHEPRQSLCSSWLCLCCHRSHFWWFLLQTCRGGSGRYMKRESQSQGKMALLHQHFCDRCAVIKSVYQKSQSRHATSFVSDGKGCHVTYIRGDPAAHGGKCGKVQSVERLFDVFVKFGWQI